MPLVFGEVAELRPSPNRRRATLRGVIWTAAGAIFVFAIIGWLNAR